MTNARIRELSPQDRHARRHDAEGQPLESNEADNPTLEDLCTCGLHQSPRPPRQMRKPLPFNGNPESANFRDFDPDERRNALRRGDVNAMRESADYPLAQGKMTADSTQKEDYRQWPLEKRDPPPPVKQRKPLPFKGESENHAQHREFSPDEAKMALRKPCPLHDGGNFWDGNSNDYKTTAQQDFDPKPLEKRSFQEPPKMRKPLPFTGQALSKQDFPNWETDARREQCSRAKKTSDDNPLTQRLHAHGDYGSEYLNQFTEKEMAKPTFSPPPPRRKPLPFQGTSEASAQLREFSPDEARDAKRQLCPMSPGGEFWDTHKGQWVTTNQTDFDKKELAKPLPRQEVPKRKPLPFTGDALSKQDFQQWEGDQRREQCTRAKHASEENPLIDRLTKKGEYESSSRNAYQYKECAAAVLLKEYPLEKGQMVGDGKNHLYWDGKNKKWF
ncbi:unnamed protein product [Amoebophrya sp. A120]|nr:unnamed protein product [Amoebophrya sp. A120]|eukprot:GSA120T00008375001.1